MNEKIVFISGASRGIGKAILHKFASAGYFCIGTATSEKGLSAIEEGLQKHNGKGKAALLNLSDSNQITDLAKQFKANDMMPDVVINNAGITSDKLFISMSMEDWQQVINTNLTSLFVHNQLFVKAMLRKRWGRIVSISSVVGLAGNPGQCNYAASKAGMIGFTKSLAMEVASRNITVNAIAPGFIESDMTDALNDDQKKMMLSRIPAARLGNGGDIADLTFFLASDAAGYITGETISCNGGMYCQ